MKLKNKVSNVSTVSNVSGVLSETKLVNIQSNHFINHLTHSTHLTHCTHSKRAAFTLAETLITLGIIGVVAAITMPTLISNHKKHFVETRLKTEVSLIQNAIRMAEAKYGFTNEWSNCIAEEENNDNFSYECTLNVLQTYLAPELKIIKICDRGNINDCWTIPSAAHGNTKQYLNDSDGQKVTAILANGSSIYMWAGGMNRNGTDPHFQLWFDIDGPKKGFGRIGGDVFGGAVYYNENSGYQLKGTGLELDVIRNDTRFGCSSDVTSIYAGSYCGTLVQTNGWKIPDDYPIKF